MRFGCCPGLESSSRRSLARLWLVVALVFAAACTPQNPIQVENALPGTPQAVWDVVGAGDPTIQGFATEISVDNGETISFKVDTDASAYRLEIYRMGWYQGNGARLVTTVLPSAALPQIQPDCLTDSTGLIDCGNWAVSASWTVPATQVSGIYFARLVRTDTNGASHVFFVVRDDGRNAPVLFQTADTTWQAYNNYGGNSLYEGNPPVGRAYKVSYNRPFASRAVYDGEDWIMNAEYPMVRWLERQGYDVAYFTGVDADRYGAQILNRKIFLSNGHDEYWSGAQRANVEAALAAGVNLAFFSGNKIFWKTRFEPSIDGSATPHRTLVCYKETLANAVIDPANPVWTGTWRDPRFSPPADGGRPENALGGSIFQINGPYNGAITLTGAEGRMRLWRSTGLESVPLGDVVTLAPGSLGTELDLDVDNGFRPPGLVGLSSTPITTSSLYLTDFGGTFGAGSGVHKVTLHRHPTSGARVFSTGTYQWSWGLDANHDRSNMGSVTDVRMMQATVNLFADMGVAPGGLQPELVYSAPPADTHLPVAVITSPTEGASIEVASVVTVNGTASDLGGRVAGIEVSTDGGTTWHPATGRETWSYTFTANAAGSATLRARAVDDSANLGTSSAPVTVTVGSGAPCATDCTIWPPSAVPATPDNGPDAPAELGLRLRATVDGFITGLRFYKSPANTGVHVGNLWASDGTPLATATFTEETASGWQQVAFPVPVAVTAGTTYVASYFAPDGHYANDELYFASQGISNPPLEALATGIAGANGVYAYGAASLFPTQTFNATNYWVDVVFSETLPPQLVSISVTPADVSVVAGSSQQYVATGTYSDSSTQDLSAQVAWASTNVAAATVAAGGLATGVAPGTTTITATLGAVSGDTELTVTPPPLAVTTASLPDAGFGAAYDVSVSATGGVPPYTWAVSSGALPPGLSLVAETGAVTGATTQSGAFGFVVEVTDATSVTATRPLSITVGAAPLVSLLVTPEAPTMNTGGTLPFSATGTYADASTQDLTASVTWGSSNGAIVTIDAGGLATAQATGTGTISATLGTVSDGTAVSVEPGSGLEVVTSGLPDATVAAAYGATLAGSGGVPPYAWVVAAGLPPGLTVDTGTGGISGTPTAPGVYSFVVELTDAELAIATRPLSITVAPAPLVSIAVTPAAPSVVVGAQQAFIATGTYADASTQDLSAQVTWASSDEGVATIDGDGLASTVSVGTTTIAATIGETSGGTVLTVAPTAPEITTGALPNGSYGLAYSATLAAAGGTPPYTWAVASGLPPGLALNTSTGEITGSPLAGGAYGFTAELTDATLQTATRALGITIPAVENYSLWPETAVPTQADGGPDAPVTVGVRFRSDQDGFITGLRFYKHPLNTGTHVGNLWTESGALLGTLTFTGETASGWQQANFGAPIPVTADTVYVASYFVPNGHYSADEFYFQGQGVDSPPLHAPQSVFGARNGLYAYGPASTFPDQNYNGSNYWVDVVFTGDPPPPLVSIAVTPPSPTIETGGGTQQLLATGTYADASTLDISSQVTWEVGTPAVATVSATGLATALTPGSTTVTATLGTVSGGASLNVALGTLAVTTTALPSVVVGLPYSATLAASGGIPPYTWSIASGLPAGLVLDPETGGISGIPTEIGSFPFSAEVSDTSAQTASVPLSITVDPVPVLNSIAVTPAAPALDSGTSEALTATGTYSNGSQQNLTALVAWSSSTSSVATVSPTGVLTAWNAGSATLTATLGAVDGTASVTVNVGVPGATGGPGGPILVVTHEGNPYSRYLVEILEAEGLQAWTVMDVANVSPATLAAYDVVVLGEFPLTAAQVSMLETWVSAGGNLIAMRPDKQLATLLGLSDLAATLPNGYLRVETAGGPGAGIVGETIQYHGTSDVYALDGATQVAELYADATTATAAPAVTLHQPLLGRAAAFTYDLARSVVWSRQGNPAWSGQSRSGTNPIRPVELFFGNAPGDVQPDWVNLDKVAIPQADEQQRLLANLILQMNLANRPLPRFWYLPSGHKAAIVMTGDDHANGGTTARFDAYASASVPGCSVADWECIRGTSYVYVGSLSPSQASFYESQGFEVSLHIDTGCANWFSPASLTSIYTNQHVAFAAAYPGVPAPTTNRTHCIVWSDFDSQPQVELAHGVRLDTTYYYFPGAWVQDRPGFMTGSGMPMRFADRNGNRIDVYQAATQLTDESAQSYPTTVEALLDGALGANGYYGVFTANMHTDFASAEGPGAQAWAGSNAIVASAQSRGVPVVTARQMLTWLDGRNASSFGGLAWDGNVLAFTVTAGPGANNLRAMLPVDGGGVTLQTLSQGGSPVPFTTVSVKGVVYAMFPAVTGAYEATYQ